MTEESCLFVSSRGIAKSCKYRNDVLFSSESGVRFTVNEPIRFFALTKKVNTIYVCTSATQQFVERILPTITKKFVLITGDSDNTVPEGCAYSSVILSHPYLSAWFSQNCFGGHPKLHQIPIGLDYHTLSKSDPNHPWGKSLSSIDQEIMLRTIQSRSVPFFDRIIKCYATFHLNTYNGNPIPDRIDAKNLIDPSVIDYQDGMMDRETTWTQMSKYAFIPSPKGAGPDCHRTWESLALGCIPIVKTSPLDPMFEGLPVWIVQSWSDITQESMNDKILEYMKTPLDYSKLQLSYWIKKITSMC